MQSQSERCKRYRKSIILLKGVNVLNLIPKGLLSSINYGAQGVTYRCLFDNAATKTLKLFTNHKTYMGGTGMFYLPKQWAPTLLNVMNKMLVIDPELKFISLVEEFGRLKLDFTTSKEDAKLEIMDLIHKAQNRLDIISHGLVARALEKNPTMKNKDEKWLLIRGVLHTGC